MTQNNSYALLVECDPSQTLGGSCLRDVRNMANFLVSFGYDPHKIYVLKTVPMTPSGFPPDVNMRSSKDLLSIIDSLIDQKPDFMVVLLSGHGYSVNDVSGDEMDHHDEAINVGETILDDQLYDRLVKKMPCRGLLMTDTCHSGTMFDLPYVYNNSAWVLNTKRTDLLSTQIFSLSACNDQQCSMCDVGDKTGFGGSLTTALLNLDQVMTNLLTFQHVEDTCRRIQQHLAPLGQQLILASSIPNTQCLT
jgi:hypothetical protein